MLGIRDADLAKLLCRAPRPVREARTTSRIAALRASGQHLVAARLEELSERLLSEGSAEQAQDLAEPRAALDLLLALANTAEPAAAAAGRTAALQRGADGVGAFPQAGAGATAAVLHMPYGASTRSLRCCAHAEGSALDRVGDEATQVRLSLLHYLQIRPSACPRTGRPCGCQQQKLLPASSIASTRHQVVCCSADSQPDS